MSDDLFVMDLEKLDLAVGETFWLNVTNYPVHVRLVDSKIMGNIYKKVEEDCVAFVARENDELIFLYSTSVKDIKRDANYLNVKFLLRTPLDKQHEFYGRMNRELKKSGL